MCVLRLLREKWPHYDLLDRMLAAQTKDTTYLYTDNFSSSWSVIIYSELIMFY